MTLEGRPKNGAAVESPPKGPGGTGWVRSFAKGLFGELRTHNFERVLDALATTAMVAGKLGHDVADVRSSYDRIRAALIAAVHSVHVQYRDIPRTTLAAIKTVLLDATDVFSTNYDLIAYWALMSDEPVGNLKDCFIDGQYRAAETWSGPLILYLHGAIHYVQSADGVTYKRHSDQDAGALLTQFGTGSPFGDVPMFVSEGTSEDKMAAIRRSDYLSFAYREFRDQRSSLVVFGQSLDPAYDGHLLEAMRQWRNRPIAFSMLPAGPDQVRQRYFELRSRLPSARIELFDASTHPLGASTLRVG